VPSPCHHRTTTVSRSYRRRTTTHHLRSFYLSVMTRVCFPPTNWVPLAVLPRWPPLCPAPAKHCTRTVRTIPGLHPVSLMCAGSRCVPVLRIRSSDVACVTGINHNPYVPNGWPEQATPESYEHATLETSPSTINKTSSCFHGHATRVAQYSQQILLYLYGLETSELYSHFPGLATTESYRHFPGLATTESYRHFPGLATTESYSPV